MRLHFSVRTVIYSVVVAAVVVIAAFALSVYLRGWSVPSSLTNSGLVRGYTSRLGVNSTLTALRIGCFTSECGEAFSLSGLEVELATPQPIRVHLGGLHIQRRMPSVVEDLRIQLGSRRPLLSLMAAQADLRAQTGGAQNLEIGLRPDVPIRIASLDFSAVDARATVRGLLLPLLERSTMNVDRIDVERWKNAVDGWLSIDRVGLSGLRPDFQPRTSSLTLCEELPASMAVGREAVAPLEALPLFAERALTIVRQDLVRVAMVVAALLVIVKLLSVLWMKRWPSRVAVAFIPAILPFALYYGLRTGRPLMQLALIATGVLLLTAIVCRFAIYRKGGKWYQRWEPFFVDVAGIFVLLLLLPGGFQLPGLPVGPGGLRVQTVEAAAFNVGAQGQQPFNVPPIVASSISVSLPAGGRDMETTIESVSVAAMQIVPSRSARVSLQPTIAERIRITVDASRMEARSIFAHVRTAGSFTSSGLLPDALREIEFPRRLENRTGPLGFAVDLTATSPDLQSPVSSEFNSVREAIAVNAALDVRPAECDAAFRLAARFKSEQIVIVTTADGDAKGVDVRSLRSLPGSPIQIASGNGHIAWVPRLDIRLNAKDLRGSQGETGNASDFSVQSVDLTAMLPAIGQRGSQSAALAVGPTVIRNAQGTSVRIDGARADYNGRAGRQNVALVLNPIAIDSPQGSPIRIASTRLDIDAQPTQQTVAIVVGDTRIGAAPDPAVRIAGTRVDFNRTPGGASVPVSFRTRVEDVRYEDRREGTVLADLPLFEATIEGRTPAGILPRSLDGTAAFRLSDGNPGNTVLTLNRTLAFDVNFENGRINVPLQDLALREGIVSQNSSEIPLRVRLNGTVSSGSGELNSRLVVPHFEYNHGSIRFSASTVELTGQNSWNAKESTSTIRYGGDLRIQVSGQASAACLDEISTLDLTTQGAISGIAQSGSLPQLPRDVSPCVPLPNLSRDIRTRLSGVIPAAEGRPVELGGGSGPGLRAREFGSAIRNLRIPRGHLARVDGNLAIRGIQNRDGQGDVNLEIDIAQDPSILEFKGMATAADGARLLELNATTTPAKTTLDAVQHAPAGRLLEAGGPILSVLGLNLESLAPESRLVNLHAEGAFEGDELREATLSARLSGGPLIAVDSSDRKFNVASAPAEGPSVQVKMESLDRQLNSRKVTATVNLPETEVHTRDSRIQADVSAALGTEARGVIVTGTGPRSPVLGHVSQVIEGLRAQATKAANVLSPDPAPPSNPVDSLKWKLALVPSDPQRPFLRIAQDLLEVRASIPSFEVEAAAWQAAQQTSSIAGSGSLNSAIASEGEALLVDIRSPVNATLRGSERPTTPIEVDIPLQVVFSPKLTEASSTAAAEGSLWNAEYYTRFWEAHPSRFGQADAVSPFSFSQLTMGPLSMRQAVFPTSPLQISVGYSDALQLDVPFTARALYGKAAGRFQASVVTNAPRVSLSTWASVDMQNLQASGMAMDNGAGYNAVVDDEFNGKVRFRMNGFPLEKETLAALRTGSFTDSQLQTVGLFVNLERSPEVKDFSGMFQASTGMKMNLVNRVLNEIADDLRLTAPPRSMTYKDFSMNLEIDRGVVQSKQPVMVMGGLQLFSTNRLEVEGNVRAHIGGPEERVRLKDLIDMIRGIAASGETD